VLPDCRLVTTIGPPIQKKDRKRRGINARSLAGFLFDLLGYDVLPPLWLDLLSYVKSISLNNLTISYMVKSALCFKENNRSVVVFRRNFLLFPGCDLLFLLPGIVIRCGRDVTVTSFFAAVMMPKATKKMNN
jgi:hypothetical protein